MVQWTEFPYEVQLLVVVEAVNTPSILNPVSPLLDFLLLSRDVHDQLVGCPQRGIPPHNDLFRLLFETRFDVAAPKRRFAQRGVALTTDMFATAFKQRSLILREIRNGGMLQRLQLGAIPREQFETVLWEIYMMLLEDDGKNMAQLEHAGIDKWLRTIMLSLAAYELDEDGWPQETAALQLATASFAIVSDRASVLREGHAVNREIIDALEPILLAPHRYPHAYIPITCFYPRHIRNLPYVADDSLRSMATMPVSEVCEVPYFDHYLLLSPPPVAPNVALIVTNRQEQVSFQYSPHLPANREEADVLGFEGLTREEWDELNRLRNRAIGVETPRAGGSNQNLACLENPLTGSKRWDHLVNRMHAVAYIIDHPHTLLTPCWFNAMYTPGMFSGYWLGRIVYPDSRLTQRMHQMHPATLAEVRDTLDDGAQGTYTNFFQANFREHITTDIPIGHGEDVLGHGIENGYFPSSVDPTINRNMVETGTEVLISDPREDIQEWAIKRYETLREGMKLPELPSLPRLQPINPSEVPEEVEMDFAEEGITTDTPHIDIVITGETDYRHGKAFWAYHYYGRVRQLDGLIVLVRVSQNPSPDVGLGRWVFSGYMQLANTIVGTWRAMGGDVHLATPFQAPFIISKLGPDFNHVA